MCEVTMSQRTPSFPKDEFAPTPWRSLLRVGFVLLVGCGASIAWWVSEKNNIKHDAEVQLEGIGARLTFDVSDQLSRIEHLLYGARGLYAINEQLDQRSWNLYWDAGDAAAIAGLHSLAFFRRVPRADEAAFLAEMRRQNGPQFRLTREEGSGDLMIIVFRRAFPPERDFTGLDRSSEPALRRSAEMTQRTGQLSLTGPIGSIMDPTDTRLLLILPVYRANQPTTTEAERVAAHHSWLTAGVRPQDFFTSAFTDLPSGLVLRLEDVSDAHAPQLLYDSAVRRPIQDGARIELEHTFYGRTFKFQLAALPGSFGLNRARLANELFFGGLLISSLVGMLIWSSMRTERRSQRIADEMTRELHEREWILQQAQRIAHVGTCIYDVNTQTYVCSDECCRIIGVPAGAASAHAPEKFLAMLHGDDRTLARTSFAQMQRGEAAPPHQLRLITPDRGVRIIAVQHEREDKREAGRPRVIATLQDITDQIAADEALAESHRQIENLMRALPGAIFQLLRTSTGTLSVSFLSEGASTLFGYPSNQLIEKPEIFFRCVNEDRSGEFLRTLEASAETLRPWHHEVKISLPGGGFRWVRFNAVPMRDPERNALVWNGVALDVTETKKAEQALRESEQRLRMTQFAVDHVRDAVAFIGPAGDRIYVNDETCRLTGHTREELLQTKIWSTFTAFTAEPYAQLWAQVKNRGTHVFEAALRTRSGELRSVEVSLSFIGFGGQEMVFAIARDVSARKEAEKSLRDSEERLRFTRYALDHAHDVVSIVGREGDRLYVNDTFCQFHNRSREELFQSKVWESIPSLNRERYQALWDEIKRRQTLTYDIEIVSKTGETKPLEVNASYINFGGREAVCTISRDITARRAAELEKKRIQQQLQETQKLESLGVLAGGIAHDFNNLLTGVLGNASLARDRLGEGSDLHEPLRQIERAAMRAAELCQQMLAYAGKGRFVVEPINLSALVEDMAKLLDLSVARRAHLELRLAPNLPAVMADATQLRQIVMNLVLNAAEAMNQVKGQITVVTGRMQVDHKFLRSARVAAELAEGEGVFLEVSDNGSGMDRQTLERIFEPFFTTKFTGRGLGLAAVLGIVRSHRGALQVTSETGRGTSFKLVLASNNQTATPSAGTPPIFPPTKRNHGRIFVIDDEESVRSVTVQALERTGFTVETAADGEAAIERLRQTPNAFLVILLDYTMPRLDGAETLREIRRINPDAKVILMSGFPEQEARERIGDASLSGFIQKPFDIATLRKRVEEIVQASPQARPTDQATGV